ncbi:MAG: ftsQ [Caulobacter sp.]|nr:ftsQ [Caulobacter sp.]
MPAAVRGGGRSNARPRAKAPASPKKGRGRPGVPASAAKLHAARAVRMPPIVAGSIAVGVLALGLIVTLATQHRGERLVQSIANGIADETAAVGFRVKDVHVQGASAMASADILRAAGITPGQPILTVNLAEVRARLLAVGWVKEVRVVRLLPDTLVLAVTERTPMAVWQHGGQTLVVDLDGKTVREADPGRFPDLPLIVGAGADEAAPTILGELAQRPWLKPRLEALVRVDGRRWDLKMKDGTLVQLPAVGEDSALVQLEQLNERQRILDLGFARIDLREPNQVVVRQREGATAPPVTKPVADGL